MTGQGTSGLAVTTAAAGALIAWSGIRGTSLTGALRELISGRQPSGVQLYPLTDGSAAASSSATSTPVTATGSTIANDALRYQGHPYLYGGAPGPSGQAPWDCSSFVNWVLGHDLGMTLPGSTTPGYSGASHGPTTLGYLAWSRAVTVGHSAAVAQAGDLCVWPTHIGIALGGNRMISALNPQLRTLQSPVDGQVNEPLTVRRIIIGNPHA